MAHKTFISYKFSDAEDVRDRIIKALGDDATYYKGEDGYSRDLSSYKADVIKEYLKDMIYDTSVTILVISPEMLESNWIPWEIQYSLEVIKRGDLYSSSNGVVGVIKKILGGYSWIKTSKMQSDGCITSSYDSSKLLKIVDKNRCNQTPKVYACEHCKSIDWLNGSYIALVEEDEFLNDPSRFIDNAFDKSQHLSNYDIHKRV